jgi:predicted Zn-dependent protease
MFFTRLRRHAKWMFVFLALVFGLGFVVFGIGSDQGTGIGDILRDQGGTSSGLSVDDARERVADNPRNTEAQYDLAVALQEEGETRAAVTVLEKLVQQDPTHENALRDLAGLHLSRATTLSQVAQSAQIRAAYLAPGAQLANPLQLGDSGATLSDPIQDAVTTQASAAVTDAYTRAQEEYVAAVEAYEKLAAARPNDPNVQLELAQAAQQSGDVTKAIAAYERFLVLAPDDPSAEIVREQVKQLKGSRG